MNESYKRLIEHGIKPSVQRLAIMEYLIKHRTHPSVDEIYSALSLEIPTLSKTTVYNTLKLFAENGASVILTIDEKNANFDADMTPHAHFLCKQCGKIYDLPLSVVENEGKINGHQITEQHFYYKGICKECLEKNKKN